MVSSRVVGWAAGTAVVLGGVQAWLINHVDAGARWWVAAVVVTVVAAVLAGQSARYMHQSPSGPSPSPPVRQGMGSVVIGPSGKVAGSVRTKAEGLDARGAAVPVPGETGDVVGPAAVRVDGEVGQDVSAQVTGAGGTGSGTDPAPAP